MFTLEVYRTDRRTRKGERLVLKKDYDTENLDMLTHTAQQTWPSSKGFRIQIHKTFVVRRNAMNGAEFTERYDTPYYLSPSSESYWSA